MPTSEYECDACGHEFEMLQRMSDAAVRKCPKCRKLKVRRLISGGAGVIFKGSGFYETDYKRARGGAGAKPGAAADGRSETKPDGKGEAKGESKGDAKGETKPAADKPAAKPDSAKKKDA